MAHLVPNELGSAARSAGEAAELETLRQLADSLTDAYTVFHGVHWAEESDRGTPIGELDFVVVNRSGAVLLVEQKAGDLSETERGLVKMYGDQGKPVADQVHRALEGIKAKWGRSQSGAGPLDAGYLLYLPHYRVVDVNAAGLAAERIVHAGSHESLAVGIERLIGEGVERDPDRLKRTLGFFRQEVRVVPSLDHALETQSRVYERLSEGLVRLGERLEMAPWRLRVIGRAGSGKSQLALRTVDRAVDHGRRVLYVCFNRPLAERVQAALNGTKADTFHGFCRELIESRGGTFDTGRANDPAFWQDVVEQVGELVVDGGPCFETLVVDEGQDFEQEWWEILRLCLAEDAEILWVEDPLQNLGGREPVELPEFVTYRTEENHRSPPAVIRALEKQLGIACTSRNDVTGDPVAYHTCRTPEEQRDLVNHRIWALVEAGYTPEDIVILTVHGFHHSAFSGAGAAGGYPLRRFTGEYTDAGRQVYAPGRVLFDSVYRFKGQQAPAVILVDVDFDDWRSERARRVLYTGMTRARAHVEITRTGDDDSVRAWWDLWRRSASLPGAST